MQPVFLLICKYCREVKIVSFTSWNSPELQKCRLGLTLGTAFERGEMLLPGKKKQGPMVEIGPCH